MKKLLFVLLLLPAFAFAFAWEQDSYTDNMTGHITKYYQKVGFSEFGDPINIYMVCRYGVPVIFIDLAKAIPLGKEFVVDMQLNDGLVSRIALPVIEGKLLINNDVLNFVGLPKDNDYFLIQPYSEHYNFGSYSLFMRDFTASYQDTCQ